jgi:hypothetical protein
MPTIAILFHERQDDVEDYLITSFAEIWRTLGIEVVHLFGVDEFVPADLLIAHVDLSVVPQEYVDFARRYPNVLNGEVTDIRKASFSQLLVTREADYDGPVIVKTDLNYGAEPERLLLVADRPELAECLPEEGFEYQIFDRIAAVPDRFFDPGGFVVEKFLPEVEGGLYHVRNYYFLGDRYTCERFVSADPIVRAGPQGTGESIEPDPGIVESRHRLKMDYGKLDYVIHEGEALLLDVNKTVGGNAWSLNLILRSRLYRAAGIHSYLR